VVTLNVHPHLSLTRNNANAPMDIVLPYTIGKW